MLEENTGIFIILDRGNSSEHDIKGGHDKGDQQIWLKIKSETIL